MKVELSAAELQVISVALCFRLPWVTHHHQDEEASQVKDLLDRLKPISESATVTEIYAAHRTALKSD